MTSAPGPGASAAADTSPRPAFLATQEMRFAVVMYGGVSLAIYINGVVRELLALVRATAPATALGDAAPTAVLLADDELSGTERVYRRLGQLVGWGTTPKPDAQVSADAPVRTRFIVDVLSGSSAGGINAVFLAKALANEQSLAGLRDLWISQADLALLVNDSESRNGTELQKQKPPQSLLNSRRMYWELLSALSQMEGPEAPDKQKTSRLVDELDCWITATDIRGTLLPIDLYDRFVFERRHRKLFHFVYGSDYARGDFINHFSKQHNPFLAFAARATSAFPFAFEPMELADIDEIIRTDRFRLAYGSRPSDDPEWAPFFEEYLKPGGAESLGEAADDEARQRAFQTQAYGDGGYLDNKPFTAATSTLDRRRADVPVDRRLLYIEPDPGSPHALVKPTVASWVEHGPLALIDAGAKALARPNALANVQAALISLPRYETIREDLERLIERNREIDRVNEVTHIVDEAPRLGQHLPEPPPLDQWRQLSLEAVIDGQGLQYGAYHRLKIATVLDELAATVTKALGLDETSDEYAAIRCFIQAWASRRYPENGTGANSQNELLYRYDLLYRLRRIDFLQTRIDILLRRDETSEALLRPFDTAVSRARYDHWRDLLGALSEAKRELNNALITLRAAGRALRRRSSDNPLVIALRDFPLGRSDLRAVLDGAHTKQESVQRATRQLDSNPSLYAQIDAVAGVAADQLSGPLAASRDTITTAIAQLPQAPPLVAAVQRALRHFFDYYEQYDSVLFPVAYDRFGETDRVEIIRISPEDATDIINETASGRRKLGGTELNHFGGFLDEGWRRNDLLWGRLDGAERLITTILPQGETRAALLRDAQLAIIEDEFKDASDQRVLDVLLQALMRGAGTTRPTADLVNEEARERLTAAVAELRNPATILDFLKSHYEVDRRLDPQSTMRTTGRAARVTADVLDGISKQQPVSLLTRWLSRFGLVLWGLVEVTTPKKFAYVLWRYWRQLLLLISLAMLAVGLIFNIDQVSHAGWIGIIATIGAWLIVWALEDVFRRAGKPQQLLPAQLPPPEAPPPPKPTRSKRIWHVIRGRALAVIALVLAVIVLLAVIELWRHAGDDAHRFWQWLNPF